MGGLRALLAALDAASLYTLHFVKEENPGCGEFMEEGEMRWMKWRVSYN